ADRLDEEAVIGIAGDDGRGAGLAALQGALPGVEPEAGLDLLGVRGMAAVALVDEDGPDLLLEELKAVGVRRRGLGLLLRQDAQRQEDEDDGDAGDGAHSCG